MLIINWLERLPDIPPWFVRLIQIVDVMMFLVLVGVIWDCIKNF